MDKYVIDVPFLLRALLFGNNFTNEERNQLLHAKYGGTKVHHLLLFQDECMKKLKKLVDVPVSLAMRYGNLPYCLVLRIT
jgi:ferrochelatase